MFLLSLLSTASILSTPAQIARCYDRREGDCKQFIATVITTTREECKAMDGYPINDGGQSDKVRCKLKDN